MRLTRQETRDERVTGRGQAGPQHGGVDAGVVDYSLGSDAGARRGANWINIITLKLTLNYIITGT